MPLLIWAFCVAVLRGFCSYRLEASATAGAATIKQQLHDQLLGNVTQGRPAGILPDSARVMEALTTGIDQLEPYIAKFIPSLFSAAILPLLALFDISNHIHPIQKIGVIRSAGIGPDGDFSQCFHNQIFFSRASCSNVSNSLSNFTR